MAKKITNKEADAQAQNKMQKDMGDKWREKDFKANPENAGRKPNPFAKFVKQHAHLQVTPAEIQQAMEALLAADRPTLHGICDDTQAPFVLKIMAQQLLRALDTEDVRDTETIIKMIERIIERIAGKAPQHITVAQENNNAIDYSALTEEELITLTQLQMKIAQ